MIFDIRALPPEQWRSYKALRLEALRTDPQAFGASHAANLQHPDAFWQGRLQEAAQGETSWLLFAQDDDRLIGMIGAHREKDRAEAEVISMFVAPSERGRGIATALMHALLDRLVHAGVRRVRLAVNADQEAAVTLYRHTGFQRCDEQTVPMGDGRDHRQLLMERPLP